MGKKKSELNNSPEDNYVHEPKDFSMPLDLLNTAINNRKEEIRAYRTIIASTIIAAIAIPLGIISIGKPEVLIKDIWIIPKLGLWILGFWVLGFVLLFLGIRPFFFTGKLSREEDSNERIEMALDALEKGDMHKASSELRESVLESAKFLNEGKNALKWSLLAMLPFLLSLFFAYLAVLFGGQ